MKHGADFEEDQIPNKLKHLALGANGMSELLPSRHQGVNLMLSGRSQMRATCCRWECDASKTLCNKLVSFLFYLAS
jgi:hypothetical protein